MAEPGSQQGFYYAVNAYVGLGDEVLLAERLLNEALVAVTPGSGFGDSSEGHLRVSMMRSPVDRVWEGVERITKVLCG